MRDKNNHDILPFFLDKIFQLVKELHTKEQERKYSIRVEFNCINCSQNNDLRRLSWAGHLVRMNNDRTVKKIFHTKPDGARSVGRPKLRWEDGVDQDMKNIRGQELEESRSHQRRTDSAS